MNKAIFLDRDGVINDLIYNKERNEYEPPHNIEAIKISEEVIEALKNFQDNGFKLFLVSNQPDYAKGKTTLDNLNLVHSELHKILVSKKIYFTEYFYCYHHPDGKVSNYSTDCECRKPKPYFVLKAVSKYNIDKTLSWFIGDRDIDIMCGKNSGIKTLLIKNNCYDSKNILPDYAASNLKEACEIILSKQI